MPTAMCSILVDILTIIPFLGWGVMSIFAIPSYAAEGWMAPVVIAVGSTIICGLATREMWLRSHSTRTKFLYMVFDDKSAAARAAKANASQKVQGWCALFCVFICILFTALFLVAEYAIVDPAVAAGMPCGCETWTARGNNTDACCHLCASDPMCIAWSDAVRAANGLTAICPPGTKAGDTLPNAKNSGFSCAADGYWMAVTTFFTLGWFVVLRCRPTARTAPVAAATPGVGAEA